MGEFSFIIAGLGQSLSVTGAFLYPIIVAVSVITTFTTPLPAEAGRAHGPGPGAGPARKVAGRPGPPGPEPGKDPEERKDWVHFTPGVL